jgi:hypothetical protein
MKKRLSLIIILFLFTSIVIGQSFGYKMVTIQTHPSGARLFLNGKSIGESPASIRVQDGMLAPQYMVKVELDGYKSQLYYLDQYWVPGITVIGGCCGLLFWPALSVLIYAKEHHPKYTFHLQKD